MKRPHSQAAADRSFLPAYSIWPGWRLLMQDAGLTTPRLLSRAQLPGDLFAHENVRLPPATFFKLWDAIEQEAIHVDPAVPAPLALARVMSSDWFEPELFAALCSDNLSNALARLSTYVRLIAPMEIKPSRLSDRLDIRLDFHDSPQASASIFPAFKLVFFVQLARLATRHHIVPVHVAWPSSSMPPEIRSTYATYFGVHVKNSSVATVSFALADADRPFLTENHRMWEFFEPTLRLRLQDLERTASMVERVRSALLEALPAGEVAMQVIARKLGVSTRSLQRRLREEGTTFQETLDAVRCSLAFHYLEKTSMSGAEISFLLGFNDPNSFSRAFQGWTGLTPHAARSESGKRGAGR